MQNPHITVSTTPDFNETLREKSKELGLSLSSYIRATLIQVWKKEAKEV